MSNSMAIWILVVAAQAVSTIVYLMAKVMRQGRVIRELQAELMMRTSAVSATGALEEVAVENVELLKPVQRRPVHADWRKAPPVRR